MSTLDVVVGGLYGSEAKGHATQRLVAQRLEQDRSVVNVRVGGPNAGHTGYDKNGRAWAFRQVPVGAVVDGEVMLQIAAGSEIDLPVLLTEIEEATNAGLMDDKDLVIHPEATLIEDRHKETEGELVGRIGSTGKGIGAARADRLLRNAKRLGDDLAAVQALEVAGAFVSATPIVPAGSVIVEGVQGYALGLHAGFYPQCTTSDCRAIDFLAMAGISPWEYDKFTAWVVGRIYPIRVAGNSGPMKNEVSWDRLGLDPEFTTVTKKMRRVGLPDWDLMRKAVLANGPNHVQVALSMVDQAFPEVRDVPWSEHDPRWERANKTLAVIEGEIYARIGLVMSGPNTAAFR